MLDWAKFTELSGNTASARDNYEKLCRHAIKRTYGYLGSFKERKNQPGVEFYIDLNNDAQSLALKGQTVGWQCKWFDYGSNGNLLSGSKTKITESLRKTEEQVANLDIWILCTHKTLSRKDQDWFYGLQNSSTFELRLWNENDLEELLSGENADLYQTYFGDLALTKKIAQETHDLSISPIAKRWNHELHNEIEQEKTIRKTLGEPSAWKNIFESQLELIELHQIIDGYIKKSEYQGFKEIISSYLQNCEKLNEFCNVFKGQISVDDINTIIEFVESDIFDRDIHFVLKELRKRNLELSLYLTNSTATLSDLKFYLNEAMELLNHQLIVLFSKAGGGKTHFSAEITSTSENRPAGIFLRGHYLKKNASLDDLANRITIYGYPVPSFEYLLSAVNSFGVRENSRIPIVIDGLNEAQDPKDWEGHLELILTQLQKYPNVVLICTLRPKIDSDRFTYGTYAGHENLAAHSIPKEAMILYSEGFSNRVTNKAIKAYFKHYKIKSDPQLIPLDFFKHPLNLKTFCEVINPSAEEEVVIKSFPSSIYSLYEAQIKNSAKRIAEMSNLSIRYQIIDVENAIIDLGELFWSSGNRTILESDFFSLNRSDKSDWDANIINLLVQEGMIFREEKGRKDHFLMPSYDKLGGFLIAHYLTIEAKNNFNQLVQSEEFENKVFGKHKGRHHMSTDILNALVVNTPKKLYGKNLWECVRDSFRNEVLSLSYLIDPDDLDETTIKEYKNFLSKNLNYSDLENLLPLKNIVGHPFNAIFISMLLRGMKLADRDLIWTEHHRGHEEDISLALKQRVDLWNQNKFENLEVESLRVLLMCWLLASTNKSLRDSVTETLFNFGLKQPDTYLDIVTSLLDVNDLYIVERLLASSYGVIAILAQQGTSSQTISSFTRTLYENLFSEKAVLSTTHLFVRDYASCIIQVCSMNLPELFSTEELKNSKPPFELIPRLPWQEFKPSSISTDPLEMDFENYTIGRLVPDRGNYEYEHPKYKEIRNKILWRIFDLGWNKDMFAETDSRIASEYRYSRMQRAKTERYGKKYSWIAYYEMAGELSDQGILEHYDIRFDHDIDPFFTSVTVPQFEDSLLFLGEDSISAEEWISQGFEDISFESLEEDSLEDDLGPWILISGSVIPPKNNRA